MNFDRLGVDSVFFLWVLPYFDLLSSSLFVGILLLFLSFYWSPFLCSFSSIAEAQSPREICWVPWVLKEIALLLLLQNQIFLSSMQGLKTAVTVHQYLFAWPSEILKFPLWNPSSGNTEQVSISQQHQGTWVVFLGFFPIEFHRLMFSSPCNTSPAAKSNLFLLNSGRWLCSACGSLPMLHSRSAPRLEAGLLTGLPSLFYPQHSPYYLRTKS